MVPFLKTSYSFLPRIKGTGLSSPTQDRCWRSHQSFGNAVISTFPDSISSLLYSNFAPSNSGSPAYTLRDYVNGGQFSGFGFANFGDYLCPNSDSGITNAISNKFAALFGVEQADIDYMNQPANCPRGSPYSTSVAGAFGRDLPFLVNVLNVGKSQVSREPVQRE